MMADFRLHAHRTTAFGGHAVSSHWICRLCRFMEALWAINPGSPHAASGDPWDSAAAASGAPATSTFEAR